MKVKCPKCGSENISQLRQLTGPYGVVIVGLEWKIKK